MTINFSALATDALGFTIALAWNDAVSKVIKGLFPAAQASARVTLLYAIVITVLVIGLVALINHAHRAIHRMRGGAEGVAGPAAGAPGRKSLVQLWSPPAPA